MIGAVGCGRCGAIVDARAAFCGNCGARISAAPAAIAAAPAAAPWLRPPRQRAVAWIAVALVIVAAGVLVAVLSLLGKRGTADCPGSSCVTPELAPPAPAIVPYRSPAFGYALDAATSCPRHLAETRPSEAGVAWTVRFPELAVTDWPFSIHAEAAAARTAQQVVEAQVAQRYGAPAFVYSIPMADVGYKPGYGAVYDMQVGAGSGTAVRARAIVIAAVQNDLAIVLDSLGPWTGARAGHPNPAQTLMGVCVSAVLTSVEWPGEEPP